MHVYGCMCECMQVCVHGSMHVTPPTHPYPPHPNTPTHHPQDGTPRISQNWITLELIKIIQFCLKIWNLWRILHPWVGVWLGGWVGGWVGWWVVSGQITKNFKNVDPIKIVQFCLKIYDLYRYPYTWIGGCVGGWVGQWVGSGQMTNNLINLDLIKIIQFCLKIYDL